MSQKIKVVILGATGNGKSAFVNSVSQTSSCPESSGVFSETKGTKTVSCWLDLGEKGKKEVQLMDTQGLFDTEDDPKVVFQALSDGVQKMVVDGPIHHVFVVMSCRIQKEKLAQLEHAVKQIFGEESINFLTTVKTNCNYYSNAPRIQQERDDLIKLYKDYSHFFQRMLFVDNVPTDYDPHLSAQHREKTRNSFLAFLASHINTGFLPDMAKAKLRIEEEETKKKAALEAEEAKKKAALELERKLKEEQERLRLEKIRLEQERIQQEEARRQQEEAMRRHAEALRQQQIQRQQQLEAEQRAAAALAAARPPPPTVHHDDDCIIL